MNSVNSLSLDVGCGWIKQHVKRGAIGIDLHKGKCDVQADAHHLPFIDNAFDKVYCHAVLEHLDDPAKGLKEVKRVAKTGALVEIVIPTNSNTCIIELKRIILEFPFGLLMTAKFLWRRRWLWKHWGAMHKHQIPISAIRERLKLISLRRTGQHAWMNGRKGKILKAFLKGRQLGGYEWFLRVLVVDST